MNPRVAEHLLFHCGGLQPQERLLIVCEPATEALGRGLLEVALRRCPQSALVRIPPFALPGEEPPPQVAQAMAQAALCIGLTRLSMAHTQARQACSLAGGRYLSLPDYRAELLDHPALLVDYRALAAGVKRVAEILTQGRQVHLTSPLGSNLTFSIAGRQGNACPGVVLAAGELGSPPDVEANVAPLESSAQGVVVVDGSIPCPEIGLLAHPVTLILVDGVIRELQGEAETVARLQARLAQVGHADAGRLAELGIGMNPAARLMGNMLMDEGAMGCVHLGFGSNSTIGGATRIPFHQDFVLRHATLKVDDRIVVANGELQDGSHG